jgi:hypothetical protein
MKLYIPALLIVVLTTVAPAQNEALEVTNYMAPMGGVTVAEIQSKFEHFVKLLAQVPDSVRAAIVYMNGFKWKGSCSDGNLVEDKTLGESLSKLIPKNLRDRINLIPSDTGAISGARFYLVPVGASLPKKFEPGTFELPCCCPFISVKGPETITENVKRVRFKLHLSDVSKKRPPNPQWTVRGGKIISGQGKMAIEVEVDDSADNVRAEVSITLLNHCSCRTVDSLTTTIMKKSK